MAKSRAARPAGQPSGEDVLKTEGIGVPDNSSSRSESKPQLLSNICTPFMNFSAVTCGACTPRTQPHNNMADTDRAVLTSSTVSVCDTQKCTPAGKAQCTPTFALRIWSSSSMAASVSSFRRCTCAQAQGGGPGRQTEAWSILGPKGVCVCCVCVPPNSRTKRCACT